MHLCRSLPVASRSLPGSPGPQGKPLGDGFCADEHDRRADSHQAPRSLCDPEAGTAFRRAPVGDRHLPTDVEAKPMAYSRGHCRLLPASSRPSPCLPAQLVARNSSCLPRPCEGHSPLRFHCDLELTGGFSVAGSKALAYRSVRPQHPIVLRHRNHSDLKKTLLSASLRLSLVPELCCYQTLLPMYRRFEHRSPRTCSACHRPGFIGQLRLN